MKQEETKLKLLTDWFDKNWGKYIWDTKDSRLVINKQVYEKLIDPIQDMKLTITPYDGELVIDGWEYLGPGDINLDVYLDLDYILDYEIDHHMVAIKFLLPWLDGLLKFFGFNLFRDFADINVTFHDLEGIQDTYTVHGDETNVNNFYRKKPKYWRLIE